MLFNSIDFAIFLPIVFLLYWFVFNKNLRAQNIFLLLSSYLFYGWWDWRFCSLMLLSTLADYYFGLSMHKNPNRKKLFLWGSLLVNLGVLGFFKYYNFFTESFVDAFRFLGYPIQNSWSLKIILPVGISFYTFQTLSYSIDIYRGKLNPTKNFLDFAAFVSFFPQLVAGPIERASHLLPQIHNKRKFDSKLAIDGLRQILWGLFKKMVVADNCATFVNLIFDNYTDYNGTTLALGAVLFAFQIYGDFSGYSDIAIGTSRLFGFDIMRNFAFPYFSRDIAEFWRRWHISLSTWFRDYLYIPLGGSRGSKMIILRNVFIIFLVSGFWHGANWTFIAWGALNAIYFIPLLLLGQNRKNLDIVAENTLMPKLSEVLKILITFAITCLAWIYFRSDSFFTANEYIARMLNTFSTGMGYPIKFLFGNYRVIFFILLLILFEYIFRKGQHGLDFRILNSRKVIRWIIYLFIGYLVLLMHGGQQSFIYFQF